MPRSARAAARPLPSRILLACLAASLAASAAGCASAPTKPSREYVWPLPPDPPRVRWIRTITKESDLGGGAARGLFRVLVPEGNEDQVANPTGLALSPDERKLYVACGPRGRVLELDLEKGRLRQVANTEGYRAAFPADVAADAEGRLYVADSTGAVWAYHQDGSLRALIGKGKLVRPISLALDRKRQLLYVVEGGEAKGQNHQVEVFSLAGQHLRTIGKRGGAPGEFNFLSRAAVSPDGHLYVADTLNFRIQVFDPEGGLVATFGSQGNGFGQFLKVKGLAFDPFGNLHAVDTEQGTIQILNPEHRPLMAYGGKANRVEFMQTPGAAVIDSKGNIYVTDYASNRVNQYRLFNVTAEDSFKAVAVPADEKRSEPPAAPKP
jgi:DNA-binding beta-propeller fold protein YncE